MKEQQNPVSKRGVSGKKMLSALLPVALLGLGLGMHQWQGREPGALGAASCTAEVTARIGGRADSARRYGVEYRAELCSAGECTSLVTLSGALDVRARPVESNGDQTLELQLTDHHTGGDVLSHLPSKEALATAMAVKIAPNGSVVNVSYARQVDVSTQRLLESLVRELQVQRAPCEQQQEKSWSGVERLVLADVASNYQSGNRPDEIRWKRQQILLWKDQDGLLSINERTRELPHSEHVAHLDANGHVASLSGKDEYVLQAEGEGEMRLRTSVALSAPGAQGPTALVAGAPGAAPVEARFTQPASRSEIADAARIAGHDVTSILAEQKRGELVGEQGGPSASRLYVAASALFRRDQKAAEQAADLVRQGHSQSEFLLHALGDAGTGETSALLAELLQDGATPQIRTAALIALGRVQVASAGVVEAMVAATSDPQVGGTALLMLGALAKGTREGSPESSETAVQALIGTYETSPVLLERADALRALGNAGSVAALATIRRAAASKNAVERAAAAQGLRLIPSDAADRVLATLMLDSDTFVRRNALDAALYRDATEMLVPVVDRIAREEKEATVRREAIRALVRWNAKTGSAAPTLTWIAQNDPEGDLRKVAVEGLSRHRTAGRL